VKPKEFRYDPVSLSQLMNAADVIPEDPPH